MTRLKIDGQAMRLLRYLRDNPGASSLDIIRELRIVNTTGRISDLRRAGYVIECRRRPDGYVGYLVIEPKPVTAGVQEALSL